MKKLAITLSTVILAVGGVVATAPTEAHAANFARFGANFGANF